ncbi:MAG: CPBP family intramembrane glutamic endopeptidase [Candidatus Paceibacterota bacterium]|jgi:membrane protease YdiL (CAAX protease family)
MKISIWILSGFLVAGITAILNNAGIQPLSWIIWLGFALLYAYKNKDFSGIGLMQKNLKSAIMAGIAAGVLYGLMRGLILVYVPNLNIVFESGLTTIMDGYAAEKFPLVNISVSKFQFMSAFIIMSFIAVACWEIFYRGFLFMRISKYLYWPIAALIVAFVNGLGHFDVGVTGFYHSLVLFTVAGALMYRYKNIAAPFLFHYIHFFITFYTVLFLK